MHRWCAVSICLASETRLHIKAVCQGHKSPHGKMPICAGEREDAGMGSNGWGCYGYKSKKSEVEVKTTLV